MAAGYSGTPLIKKLGIKSEHKLLLINKPDNYFELIGEDVTKQLAKPSDKIDLVHLFILSIKEMDKELKKLKPVIKKNTAISIWVSWYKKSAKMNTDVNEDAIRDYALANDLVDVKVCAVSDLWSGLKLVVPLKKR